MWTLVSNNLGLTSRRFTIRQLQPETLYEFKIRANNPAGSTENQFKILTRSSQFIDEYNLDENNGKHSSSAASGDMGSNAARDQLVLHQIQFIVPMVIGILLVVVLTTGVAVCMKRSKLRLSINYFYHVFLANDILLFFISSYCQSFYNFFEF